jgi:hypothetical protein
LSVANYDALLVGWNAQNPQANLTFDGGFSKYCAITEHDNLTSNLGHKWTITDAGLGDPCLPNDDPTITGLPSDVTLMEDVIGNIDLTTVIIADSDSGNEDVTLTLTVGSGQLFSTSANGVSVTGDGTLVIALVGNIQNINSFLNNATSIQYLSALNANGNDVTTISIIANDGGNIGIGGGSDVNLGFVNIDITAVNDNPTITGLPTDITVTEDVISNLDLSMISLSDLDAGNNDMTLVIETQAANLAILSASNSVNIAISNFPTNTLTLVGSISDINSYLSNPASIQFKGGLNNNGNDADLITFTANDGGNTGTGGGVDINVGSVNIDISAVNDDPDLAILLNGIDVIEDTPKQLDLSQATFTDVDSSNSFVSFTLTVNNGTLAANNDLGVTIIGSTTSILALSGTASNIDSYLNNAIAITYIPEENSFGNNAATLSFSANDGGNSGVGGGLDINYGFMIIDITAVNDDPTLINMPTDITVTEDVASNVDLSAVTFADVDSNTLNVSFDLVVDQGSLTATSVGGVIVSGSSSNSLQLVGSAPDIDGFLNNPTNIKYTSSINSTGNNAASLSLMASDSGNFGSGGGGLINFGTINIDISAVNDDPTITGLPTDITVIEDTNSDIDLSMITLNDIDAQNASIDFILSVSGGKLFSTGGAGVVINGHTTDTLVLSGTVNDINNFLNNPTNIYFRHENNVSGDNTETLALSANDGGNTGVGGGITIELGMVNIDITEINDKPTFTNLPSVISLIEDTLGNVNLSTATFSDVDSGASDVSLSFFAIGGTFSATSDASITISGSTTDILILTGTESNIENYLNTPTNIKFKGATNSNGSAVASFTIFANDGGNTGTGGGFDDFLATVNIDITAVNDSPSFSIAGGLELQDSDLINPLHYELANFTSNISFGPSDESNQGVSAYIVTIVSDDNSIINSAAIDNNGQLLIDFFDVIGQATLEVILQDDGGTASGGQNTSSPQQFTISFNDIIYSNGFETTVIVFKSAEKSFTYDFSHLVKLNLTPLLIAKGMDNNNKENSRVYLRSHNNILQIQIRQVNEDNQWLASDWQTIDNKTNTTISW